MRGAAGKVAAAVAACALAAFAGPGLRFAPSQVDFGELGPMETAERAVAVENVGSAPVRIVRVSACCGAKASMPARELRPSSAAELRVSVTAGARPGPFRKTVTVVSDDPGRPLFSLALVGRVRATHPTVVGDSVEFVDAPPPDAPPRAPPDARRARLSLAVPTVLLAGVVDGFNPCSFAIMVSLAGILAIGGRRRRARILGGLAFCAGTFLTYMLMGFGLLRAIQALEGLRVVHDVAMALLATSLFALSFLSFRDALRFHRVPVFSVVTLKLPEGVRDLIRRIALSSWRGPAVVLAGFGCAFLVTLLDALCTGQVYVPVLALLAREGGSARAAALLVAYNLAFVAPLVAVFVLASRTTDAFQMAKWSSRNVVPAKVALGLVFALLGWLLWPKQDAAAARDASAARPGPVSAGRAPGGRAAGRAPASAAPAGGRGRMADVELAEGNERLEALLREPRIDPGFPEMLASAVADGTEDEQWRNHCLQFVPDCMLRLEEGSPGRELLASALGKALAERSSVLSGTALLGYARLSEETGRPTPREVCAMAVAIASDASAARENVVTALRVCAERGEGAALPAARYWARNGEGEFLRCVAVSAVRDLGGREDAAFLRSLLPARTRAEESMVENALKALEVAR